MDLSSNKLALLDGKYDGYLEGSRIDELFEDFGIRFAAGDWCAGEFFDRFCTVGYNYGTDFDSSKEANIARVAQAGIKGVEFHDGDFLDAHGAKDAKKIATVLKALAQHSVVPTNMNFLTWAHPKYMLGGVTNPDAGIRREARAQVNLGIDIAKEMGFESCGLWPGSDGFDYHFEVNYAQQFAWFIEACTEFTEHADRLGLKFGTEPKAKEPREGAMITNTVAKAACVCIEVNRNLGKPLMGVAIDYGHEQMTGSNPAESLYFLKVMGIPIANFHINAAKFNSNDEDRIAGTDDIWRLVEFCYAALDTGYNGWFGEDQFTYRTEQVASMSLSREFFANAMKKALKLFARRAELDAARATGDAVKSINVVKRVIYNG